MASEPASTERSLPARWVFVGDKLALFVFLLSLLTLAGFAARWWWRCEQLVHFRGQYFVLLSVLAVALFVLRKRRWALLATAMALVNLAYVAPLYWPVSTPVITQSPAQRLLCFNVLSRNTEHDIVLAYLREQQADVVVLLEVSDAWATACESLRDLYPHQHHLPRGDNFGISLLSRAPWQDLEVVSLGTAALPSIKATYEDSGRAVTILGTHPLPPGSAEYALLRNEQLQAIATLVRQQPMPVIVVGDLNITSYSPYFQELLQSAKLHDSRQGIGLQASWSPGLPGLEIPIDHALVTVGIAIAGRKVGPYLGSDHRPVVLDWRHADNDQGVTP